jgi:hypothetical protein
VTFPLKHLAKIYVHLFEEAAFSPHQWIPHVSTFMERESLLENPAVIPRSGARCILARSLIASLYARFGKTPSSVRAVKRCRSEESSWSVKVLASSAANCPNNCLLISVPFVVSLLRDRALRVSVI